jgi:hypothetical protein
LATASGEPLEAGALSSARLTIGENAVGMQAEPQLSTARWLIASTASAA